MTDTDTRKGNGQEHPPMVAIGASAGGVHALQDFFSAIPDDTGASFVVVVHLDPQRRSELPNIISACTRMPVIQVREREKLNANRVYVIPPDRRLQIVDHEISAVEFDEPRGHRLPIDSFFRSVAERLGDRVAIVLSGAGSDGTIGVRAVKEAGGIILVQDPGEAEYASMPRSAIGTGGADFVLPVRELATRLVDLIQLKKNKVLEPAHEIDEDLFRRVLAHLRVRTGREVAASDQDSTRETARRLTRELELTQARRLHTVREESDAANKELQSINEELQTVNSELKLKLDTISRAHSDLQNLMAATDFGTLFVDSNLRIKRFTDRVTQLFSITPADEGRPITDFAHQLEYDDLIGDVQSVLANLAPVQRETHSRNGRWYDVRIRPYRTVDNKIDGVVITFVDVSDRRQVERTLRENEQQLQQLKRLIDLSRDPILIWDFDGGVLEWNRGCEELYGYAREEAMGKAKEQLLHTVVPGSSFADLKNELQAQGTWNGVIRQRTKDGRTVTVESRFSLENVVGRRLVLESIHDITEHEILQERQQLLLGELTHRVKNTLAVVQSVARQTLRNSPSPEDFIARFEGRLSAMANAHGLLVQSNWEGADLAELVRVQLEPYTSDSPSRVKMEGPRVALSAELATPFGLVLHELASNAAMFGAWSRASGRVDLTWSMGTRNQPPTLTVKWQETGGPRVATPTRRGFGSNLIENGIPDATVHREFKNTGFVCTIELPLPEGSYRGHR